MTTRRATQAQADTCIPEPYGAGAPPPWWSAARPRPARTLDRVPDERSDDPSDERPDMFDQTAEFVADELEGVAGDLEHVWRQVLAVLRADLLSRDGYLIVLIMVLLTIVMIAIDDAFTGGQVVIGGHGRPAGAGHAQPVARLARAAPASARW